MERKKMTRSKAEAVVREVTEAFFEGLAKIGLEVGEKDVVGEVITEERWAHIRQIVDDAGWNVLHECFIIIED